MPLDNALDQLTRSSELIALAGAGVGSLIAGLWAYSKFVVVRAILPGTQFDIECAVLGTRPEGAILEIGLAIENVGTSVLILRDLRIDIRYLPATAPGRLGTDRALRGRLLFPNSLAKELGDAAGQEHDVRNRKERPARPPARGLVVVAHDTFVQAKVKQRYVFVTMLPAAAEYVLLWSSFEYAQRPSQLQRAILWLSRRLGLVHFSLSHVTKPHTSERAFAINALPHTSRPR